MFFWTWSVRRLCSSPLFTISVSFSFFGLWHHCLVNCSSYPSSVMLGTLSGWLLSQNTFCPFIVLSLKVSFHIMAEFGGRCSTFPYIPPQMTLCNAPQLYGCVFTGDSNAEPIPCAEFSLSVHPVLLTDMSTRPSSECVECRALPPLKSPSVFVCLFVSHF